MKKCEFCAERQAQGELPACASVCPSGALTFGRRDELILEARRRLYAEGSTYVPHIYGEEEAGGTSWLYITDVKLEALGLPTDVPNTPYASLASGALSLVPFVITLWPPLLLGIYTFSQRRAENEAHTAAEDRHALAEPPRSGPSWKKKCCWGCRPATTPAASSRPATRLPP